jgi:hypothetical protein
MGGEHMKFDDQYPQLTASILGGDAWIELGQDESSGSTVRVLDIGGMIWESEKAYATVAEALADAEAALQKWVD